MVNQSYICSDTNVWIDFCKASSLELPFRLAHTYLMYKKTFEDELVTPIELPDNLLKLGVQIIEAKPEEIQLASQINLKYSALSIHDSFAYSIAKIRKIPLLTGDKRLRTIAEKDSIIVIGTIGILNRLYNHNKASKEELLKCANALKNMNGGIVRLPRKILEEFIKKVS